VPWCESADTSDFHWNGFGEEAADIDAGRCHCAAICRSQESQRVDAAAGYQRGVASFEPDARKARYRSSPIAVIFILAVCAVALADCATPVQIAAGKDRSSVIGPLRKAAESPARACA
jgi:hypothetical protein